MPTLIKDRVYIWDMWANGPMAQGWYHILKREVVSVSWVLNSGPDRPPRTWDWPMFGHAPGNSIVLKTRPLYVMTLGNSVFVMFEGGYCERWDAIGLLGNRT